MQPNILFIMTDQQRFDGCSVHGGQARTPNLDKLAAGGADLRKFFTQAPVCVPSRCNLFSGRYSHSHRVRENNTRLARHEVHLFKALKQAGYHLGYVGKNHLLEESEMSNFDLVDLEEDRTAGTGARAEYVAFKNERRKRLQQIGAWASAAFYSSDPKGSNAYMNRESAIKFLSEAPANKPFCLTVSFADPHAPHVAPEKFESMYNDVRLPPDCGAALEEKAPRFLIKQKAQKALDASDADKRKYLAVYYSMISWVDENVGAILAELDKRGQRENTIVVFTSDHGDFNFHYGMCKKDLILLDCLLHVPCFISWPGKIQPRVVDDTMFEQVDVMPTLLELCGVKAPFGCQGKSFAPLLLNGRGQHKDTVYAEICPPNFRNPYLTYDDFINDWNKNHEKPGHQLCWTASFNVPGDYVKSIRTAKWHYIWFASDFEELYDLEADPSEFKNLARLPQYRQQCDTMKARLFEWCVVSEDPLDQMWHAKHLKEYDQWK